MSDHGPIEDKHRQMMTGVAEALGEVFRGHGYCLLVFDFHKPDRVNYISNANRVDMLAAMKEFIARNEGRMHETPTTPQ